MIQLTKQIRKNVGKSVKQNKLVRAFSSSNGQVVRASASRAVDFGFDSESGQTNEFRLIFTASLFDAQH